MEQNKKEQFKEYGFFAYLMLPFSLPIFYYWIKVDFSFIPAIVWTAGIVVYLMGLSYIVRE